jgi:hypothetical protein
MTDDWIMATQRPLPNGDAVPKISIFAIRFFLQIEKMARKTPIPIERAWDRQGHEMTHRGTRLLTPEPERFKAA